MADRMTAEERAKGLATTLWAQALLNRNKGTGEVERYSTEVIRAAEAAAREDIYTAGAALMVEQIEMFDIQPEGLDVAIDDVINELERENSYGKDYEPHARKFATCIRQRGEAI